jgi:nicotinate phosphoribosyltransferase
MQRKYDAAIGATTDSRSVATQPLPTLRIAEGGLRSGAYKLPMFDGRPALKLSAGKATLPGAKQVWRRHRAGRFAHDLITLADEGAPGREEPLLRPVMTHGERASLDSLEAARARVAKQRAMLAPHHRLVDARPHAVRVSPRLLALDDHLRGRLAPAR